METPQYLITGDRNITLVLDGQTHTVGSSHPNHAEVIQAIKDQAWDTLPSLVDIPTAISTYSEGNVVVNEFGEVSFDGQPLHNTLADRIGQFFREGLPYDPLVKFLENLMNNPSNRAVEELYTFLENEGMAITPDGCFVGYKAVRADLKDIHSGTYDNSPGTIHEMARNLVDDDARRSCSNGFHVGSQSYAASFGGEDARIMLVKVNPADAVSVPYDGGRKLRACKYEVLCEVDKTTIIQEPLYTGPPLPEPEDDYDLLDDESDWWDDGYEDETESVW